MARPEREIAVVTHSSFMAYMLRLFGGEGCSEAVTVELHRWPNNCEMRPVVVYDRSGGGGLEPYFFAGGKEGLE